MTTQTNATERLQQSVVNRYRNARADLSKWVADHYPLRSVVLVDNPRYAGMGIVADDNGCPNDKLPVLLSSGNVWWYELETIVERVSSPHRWPVWIREWKLEYLARENVRKQRLKQIG